MKSVVTLLSSLSLLIAFAGCSTAPDNSTDRRQLHSAVQETIDTYERVDPGMRSFLNRAYAYAVFPGVAKGGFVVGGAHGQGEVFEKGLMIGWCDVSQATVGAQIGGQSYSELLVFENQAALERFKRNELEFAAQASAVALRSGASADAKFDHGVAVFTMANAGAMLEASIGGQSFTYKPKTAETMNK